MAISSGSGAAVATTPEGGSPAAPSSSEDVSPSPDTANAILSLDGAQNEMLGAPLDEQMRSVEYLSFAWTGIPQRVPSAQLI